MRRRPLRIAFALTYTTLSALTVVGCEGLTAPAPQDHAADALITSPSVPTSTDLPALPSDPQVNPNSLPTPTPTAFATPSPTPTMLFNCDNANLPVCDGFETVAAGGLPDPNRWNSAPVPAPDDGTTNDHPGDNLMEVTAAKAHRGTQSLHIHTVSGTEHVVIQDLTSAAFPHAFLPAPNNTFYVRLWVYDNGFGGDLTQVPPGSSHLYMVNASGPLSGRQQYEKFGAGDGPAGPATLNWNYYGNDAIVTDANYVWPMGTWTCFETAFNGQSGEVRVWQNEVLVPRLDVASGTWQPPAFNRLTIGWEMDHPPTNFAGTDVYIDDVAYSYERIGCTR